MKALRIATCQFAVEADIAHNRRWMLKQIGQAADQGADLVHFSECALSGYAGVDIPDVAALDWDRLTSATRDIQDAARASEPSSPQRIPPMFRRWFTTVLQADSTAPVPICQPLLKQVG